MADAITLTGRLRTNARLDLHRGAARTDAPLVCTLALGDLVPVARAVTGEAVRGNARWFATGDGNYVWSGGGVFEAEPAPAAALPAVPPVIDLYHGNRVADFARARAAGVLGVIHKASTGATGRDPAYAERRAAAVAAGLLWGAYHWGTARPARDQVDAFLAAARPDETTLIALDYELDPGNQMTIEGAGEFLERLHERLGRRAVLYSGHLIKEALGTRIDPFFGAHRLWLAQYGPRAVVQPSWDGYWLWQSSDGPASVPGIPGNDAGHVDCNQFGGTPAQLATEWAA